MQALHVGVAERRRRFVEQQHLGLRTAAPARPRASAAGRADRRLDRRRGARRRARTRRACRSAHCVHLRRTAAAGRRARRGTGSRRRSARRPSVRCWYAMPRPSSIAALATPSVSSCPRSRRCRCRATAAAGDARATSTCPSRSRRAAAWISPARNSIVMSSFACTGPKRLEMPRSDSDGRRTAAGRRRTWCRALSSSLRSPSGCRRHIWSSLSVLVGPARVGHGRRRRRRRVRHPSIVVLRCSAGEHPRLQLGRHQARRRAVGRDVGAARVVGDLLELDTEDDLGGTS